MTFALAPPASQDEVAAVLVSVLPDTEAPTTFTHATGSSARTALARRRPSAPIAQRQRKALPRRGVQGIGVFLEYEPIRYRTNEARGPRKRQPYAELPASTISVSKIGTIGTIGNSFFTRQR